jgi:hypothetical protein
LGGVRGVYTGGESAGQRRALLGFWGEFVVGWGEGA